MESGSCGVAYSKFAVISVIPADIKPDPVNASSEEICIGEEVQLTSEINYSTNTEIAEGGDFNNANPKGWIIDGDPDNNFPANGNNTKPNRWSETNDHPFDTRDGSKTFDSKDKKFAIVSGQNLSTMETPTFSTFGLSDATLQFDEAFIMGPNTEMKIELSLDGGNTYTVVLRDGPYGIGSDNVARTNNYSDFSGSNRSIDLSEYVGQPNLKIKFTFDGRNDPQRSIWAIDKIAIPNRPLNVASIWNYTNAQGEEITVENQQNITVTPDKIGLNTFKITSFLITDDGTECRSADPKNSETVEVYVFDKYSSTATAPPAVCGKNNFQLGAQLTATHQGDDLSFPTPDGYGAPSWKVEGPEGYSFANPDSNDSSDPLKNPNAIFIAPDDGTYTLTWTIERNVNDGRNGDLCPPDFKPITIEVKDCTTLDFDGIDDYVSISDVFAEAQTVEMWIYPEASSGTMISSPGVEIKMSDLPGYIVPNTRWYHIALLGNKLYIDGINSGLTVNSTGTSNQTLIGAKWNNATKVPENYFSGWIEEVRIWKSMVSEKEIRFMMNQRLDLNSKPSGDVQGEIVPNKPIAGSYYTLGGFNLDKDGDNFYNEKWSDLIGYYRLISAVPDPLLNIIPDTHKPINGFTPDLALNAMDGRLHNMTTHQQNTSPTPYFDGANGIWSVDGTWARPSVWDPPNSNGWNGTAIEWNIAKINHNIQSSSKDITMLGLLSETPNMELSINTSRFIRISHYLLLNGNIDLEGESQLLQDHGSILANSSSGWLEVNQKGRMSSYNYNYWTSPVSLKGTENNSGFMLNQVLFDGDKEKNPDAVNFQNGYFVADKPKTSPITISNEWIWDFRGGIANLYDDWLFLGSGKMEIAGAGYSMKGTDGTVGPNTQKQAYTFKGKPNNGNIPTLDLYLQNDQNYLVGNPYPSAIDANQFLKENLVNVQNGNGNNENNENVFNGTLYFWDHFAGSTHILKEYIGGYATYTLAGAVPAISNDSRINSNGGSNDILPERYIPVGQGFFLNSESVLGQKFSGKIIFKNTQRVYKKISTDPSIFLQQEEEIIKGKSVANSNQDTRMKIRLKFESPKGYHRQILVTSDDNASNDFDIGYDAPLIENNPEDMYWWIENHGFVIQGVPDFEKEQILPFVIKTKEGGEFKIKIDTTENWPTGKELYLKDKAQDTIHDILKEEYLGRIDDSGEITDRFELVFFKEKAQDPVIDPDEIIDPVLPILDGIVSISYSTFDKQIKISNFDLLKVEKVMIFDLGGKLIQVFDELTTEKEIFLGMRPVRSGVYLVKVFCENGVCDKKIIVK